MVAMISISHLSKQFGPILAVDDVSFEVEKGEVLGFLGPNGAGKSTTMKMITGFLTPSGGTARVCGHDIQTDPIAVKRRIGYLPEGAPAYPDMTPQGYLAFVASVRGLKGGERQKRLDFAIERTQLKEVLDQPIDTLSKGFKRRVGLAQAILHDPEVLVLDEPTDGLDPNQKHEVRSMIREMAASKAIIISTHILEEVNALCSRALIIAHGRVVADGTPGELEARSRYHNALFINTKAAVVDEMRRVVSGVAGVARVEDGKAPMQGDAQLVVYPTDGASIVVPVSEALQQAGLPLHELHVDPGRLDDVFRSVTGEPPKAAA